MPALVIATRNSELQRKYHYAALSLTAGVLVVFGLLGIFVYLVINGHPQAAAALLGAGVLSLVGGFVRSRPKIEEASPSFLGDHSVWVGFLSHPYTRD